jgi:dTDP-4-dehydrorhamnose 3,5-epimerase
MKFIKTEIPEVVVIEPNVFNDERGYFYESFRHDKFISNIRPINFIQENESKSGYGVFRGFHYQIEPYVQSKLVRVIEGKILDIAVDIREGSPCFGKFIVEELSEENKKQLFIPRGFAHGYLVLSEKCIFQYKVDNYYSKESERGFIYNSLKIKFPVPDDKILVSDKDAILPSFENAFHFNYEKNLYE